MQPRGYYNINRAGARVACYEMVCVIIEFIKNLVTIAWHNRGAQGIAPNMHTRAHSVGTVTRAEMASLDVLMRTKAHESMCHSVLVARRLAGTVAFAE